MGFTAAMGTSASILGSAAVPALTIGICAGGIGALTALRNRYSIVKKAKGSVVLKEKESIVSCFIVILMLRRGFDDLTVNLAHTSVQELSKSPE